MTSKEITKIYEVWQKQSKRKSTYKPIAVLKVKEVK